MSRRAAAAGARSASSLVGKRHHPGVRGGAEHRNAVAEARERIAGADAAADVSRAARQHAGFGRMRAARAELDHAAARRPLPRRARPWSRSASGIRSSRAGRFRRFAPAISGARTVRNGSPANSGVPSGDGQQVAGEAERRAASRRIPARRARTAASDRTYSISAAMKRQPSRNSTACAKARGEDEVADCGEGGGRKARRSRSGRRGRSRNNRPPW